VVVFFRPSVFFFRKWCVQHARKLPRFYRMDDFYCIMTSQGTLSIHQDQIQFDADNRRPWAKCAHCAGKGWNIMWEKNACIAPWARFIIFHYFRLIKHASDNDIAIHTRTLCAIFSESNTLTESNSVGNK
jgi:hypothetical protein